MGGRIGVEELGVNASAVEVSRLQRAMVLAGGGGGGLVRAGLPEAAAIEGSTASVAT